MNTTGVRPVALARSICSAVWPLMKVVMATTLGAGPGALLLSRDHISAVRNALGMIGRALRRPDPGTAGASPPWHGWLPGTAGASPQGPGGTAPSGTGPKPGPRTRAY